jgi:hypothetical protein
MLRILVSFSLCYVLLIRVVFYLFVWISLCCILLYYIVLVLFILNYFNLLWGREFLTTLYFAILESDSHRLSSLFAELKKSPSPRLEPRTLYRGFCLCSYNLPGDTKLWS